MEDSNIFIRVGKENKLVEDLTTDELSEWMNELSVDGLKRTIFILSCALRNTKVNCKKAIEFIKKYNIYFDDSPNKGYIPKELLKILENGDGNE